MSYYLGIDGGGSKTRCAVGDAESVLGTGTAGPSNIIRVGEARAREAVHAAIGGACAGANISLRQVTGACVGVAGAGTAEIAATMRKIVVELIPAEIQVVGDMEVALAAAFGEGPGVVTIAGTGSIAYGRNAQGATMRAGGWGFAVSDEGSAQWIGRAAVAALLRSADEAGEPDGEAGAPPLLRDLKTICGVESLAELARRCNSNPDFAGLFPAVNTAAEAGDPLAQSVLAEAGRELARLAGIVSVRLFTEGPIPAPEVGLAMAGGVFRYSSIVWESFRKEVGRRDARLQVIPDVVDPVEGALQMARKIPGKISPIK